MFLLEKRHVPTTSSARSFPTSTSMFFLQLSLSHTLRALYLDDDPCNVTETILHHYTYLLSKCLTSYRASLYPCSWRRVCKVSKASERSCCSWTRGKRNRRCPFPCRNGWARSEDTESSQETFWCKWKGEGILWFFEWEISCRFHDYPSLIMKRYLSNWNL